MRRYRLALLGSAVAPALGLALAMHRSTSIAIPAARAMPARGLPTLLTTEGGSRFAIRPAAVVFLGDGSGGLGRLGRRERGSIHWTRWTGRAAFGRGTVWLNNCLPDCAQATY